MDSGYYSWIQQEGDIQPTPGYQALPCPPAAKIQLENYLQGSRPVVCSLNSPSGVVLEVYGIGWIKKCLKGKRLGGGFVI